MKFCGKCQQEKSLNDFYKNSHRSDGYQYICKECKKIEIQRTRDRDKPARIEVIDRFKRRGCGRCGEDDPVVIQLHHWPIPMSQLPWKKQSLTETSRGIGEFIRNVSACVPLCANCHLKFHAGRITLDESLIMSSAEIYEWYIEAGGTRKWSG